ncbi:hypothetical protein [Halioxenophilus sp. WMMB6]|uniref:hypothetical protein n=1 Tax=Halioxenophilus sp. WMMB6 TaxID=3073815 RepID=UPI00295EC416|nr:hypothetical protein [Halioxenophilus sp. WMMB6]
MPARSGLEADQIVFVNRRRGKDRRLEADRCKDLPLDLFHRKRRKSVDRREGGRSLAEDYAAFVERHSAKDEHA